MDIFGVKLCKSCVVIDKSGYKGVVLGALALAVFSVDKEPLYPRVSDAPRVAGEIHPFRKIRCPAKTGAQNPKLPLGKLRCLVNENAVVFQPLIFALVRPQMAEADNRAVYERNCPLRAVVYFVWSFFSSILVGLTLISAIFPCLPFFLNH